MVTGAASGIGQAVAAALEARGDEVASADLRTGDIIADLSTPSGRRELAKRAGGQAPDGLDLVVACAGVAGAQPALIVALNYFGAVATFEAVLPLLRRRPGSSAIAITSSASILPCDSNLVSACLSGDEERACALAEKAGPSLAYASSKRALSLWVRQTAVTPAWTQDRVSLNGIAPGTIVTPMTAPMLATTEGREVLGKATPIAVADYAGPEAIAETVIALSSLKSGYLLGQLLFVDGGTDAIMRPDAF